MLINVLHLIAEAREAAEENEMMTTTILVPAPTPEPEPTPEPPVEPPREPTPEEIEENVVSSETSLKTSRQSVRQRKSFKNIIMLMKFDF